ncbi:DJ-1 family glyoxalase III [Parabacteroides sp. Marseille-P3160]|uniref:DJ-1 family glyoxalase III n=1 Tax=Parabacteroides sp. Marseille-P3160 TaxID=1917887 RepID=UPI000B40D78F|nr:DJ-1 family glyoxalase III [Parabacteroides sp. Marseille-P3160]
MKKAFVFLATGFEETEAIGTADILRRGGVEAAIVSVTDKKEVKGAHNIIVTADLLLADADLSTADALVLPGGMPGASNLKASEPLKKALISHYGQGKLVAAICAAPLVLGGLGFLKGRIATCYPGFESTLIEATVTKNPVEIDGNVITGRGPGLVFNFSLAIVSALQGEAVAREVAEGLLLSSY